MDPAADRDYVRLRWRCRRGLLELDLMLHKFLDRHYASLGPLQRESFTRLLAMPDATLMAYLQGDARPDDPELMQLLNIML